MLYSGYHIILKRLSMKKKLNKLTRAFELGLWNKESSPQGKGFVMLENSFKTSVNLHFFFYEDKEKVQIDWDVLPNDEYVPILEVHNKQRQLITKE